MTGDHVSTCRAGAGARLPTEGCPTSLLARLWAPGSGLSLCG